MDLINNVVYLINHGESFEDILFYSRMREYELLSSYYEILSNYKKYSIRDKSYDELEKEFLEHIFFLQLTDEKVVLFSDTHIGSKLENMEYLEQLKDFILKEKISIIMHGGDIGDGLINHHRNYYSYDKQIEHIIKTYPYINDVKQYIIGGNHDLKYRREGVDLLEELQKCDVNIKGVGYGIAFFKLYDFICCLSHYCKNTPAYHFMPYEFKILGHSHHYRLKNSKLYLPASCDENPANYDIFLPGFVTMQAEKLRDEKIAVNFVQYAYSKHKALAVNKDKVYLKTIKEKL